MSTLVIAGELTAEHVGTLVSWDGDGAMVYGGHRPHPDGREGAILATLDGREVSVYDDDYVYLEESR